MIGTILSMIPGEVWVGLAAVVGVLAARFGWKRQGKAEAKLEAKQEDMNRAETIRKRAADARADADRENDAARILRKHGRLRD
jgi:cytochrome b